MSNLLLIYNQLSASGVSRAGALGLLGNWQAESGLEPNRLQNDFSPQRTLSKAYTADVTSGKIPRTQFARDQKGYGLAQWTYFNFSTGQGRKLDLYDFWKKSGKALDDISMQVSFALHELQTEAQYAGLWQLLQTTDDVYTAVDKVCRLYEQPYFLNIDTRFRYTKELEAELNKINSEPNVSGSELKRKTGGMTEPSSSLTEANGCEAQSDEFYPYRMIDCGMAGTDVTVLQAILAARNYYTGPIDGKFGKDLDAAVREFQKDQNLVIDGVVGPNTWRQLSSYD